MHRTIGCSQLYFAKHSPFPQMTQLSLVCNEVKKTALLQSLSRTGLVRLTCNNLLSRGARPSPVRAITIDDPFPPMLTHLHYTLVNISLTPSINQRTRSWTSVQQITRMRCHQMRTWRCNNCTEHLELQHNA